MRAPNPKWPSSTRDRKVFTQWIVNYCDQNMKSSNSKTDISVFINLRYLLIKLLKNKENNKKICHIFHHNFKNIPCYVMSEVSLKRFYFGLFDVGLTLKTLKLAFIGFLIQTLHMVLGVFRVNESISDVIATF